ncbi:MAG: hypothetical protein ACLQDI_17900, partial [Syntrophobacteraceae bacterium]
MPNLRVGFILGHHSIFGFAGILFFQKIRHPLCLLRQITSDLNQGVRDLGIIMDRGIRFARKIKGWNYGG